MIRWDRFLPAIHRFAVCFGRNDPVHVLIWEEWNGARSAPFHSSPDHTGSFVTSKEFATERSV